MACPDKKSLDVTKLKGHPSRREKKGKGKKEKSFYSFSALDPGGAVKYPLYLHSDSSGRDIVVSAGGGGEGGGDGTN